MNRSLLFGTSWKYQILNFATKLQFMINSSDQQQRTPKKTKKLTIPCFRGALKVLCISPRMEISWKTQWFFQWLAFFKSFTSSSTSSNSTILIFFWGPLRFLADFACLVTHSWEPRFWDPTVKSMDALGPPWTGGANPPLELEAWGIVEIETTFDSQQLQDPGKMMQEEC